MTHNRFDVYQDLVFPLQHFLEEERVLWGYDPDKKSEISGEDLCDEMEELIDPD